MFVALALSRLYQPPGTTAVAKILHIREVGTDAILIAKEGAQIVVESLIEAIRATPGQCVVFSNHAARLALHQVVTTWCTAVRDVTGSGSQEHPLRRHAPSSKHVNLAGSKRVQQGRPTWTRSHRPRPGGQLPVPGS